MSQVHLESISRKDKELLWKRINNELILCHSMISLDVFGRTFEQAFNGYEPAKEEIEEELANLRRIANS